MKKLLFICLGNICRSPMAEAIFSHIVENHETDESKGKKISSTDWHIDSAGTYGGHSGQPADPRMKEAAQRRGYKITHRARKFTAADFAHFDLLVVMDDSNYYDVKHIARSVADEQKIVKMTDYLTKHHIDNIPDPYYEGIRGFDYVIDLLEDACEGLYNKIK